MRDEIIRIADGARELQVTIAGEALKLLREGRVFRDGPSIVRHYRSLISELALEKFEEDPQGAASVVLTRQDFE